MRYFAAMIVVTGAAGFIGSALVGDLLRAGWQDIVAVDEFSRADKAPNLAGKALTAKVDRDRFFPWLEENHRSVQFIFHLGARTDTTEFDRSIFDRLNLHYSQRMWEACVKHGIPWCTPAPRPRTATAPWATTTWTTPCRPGCTR